MLLLRTQVRTRHFYAQRSEVFVRDSRHIATMPAVMASTPSCGEPLTVRSRARVLFLFFRSARSSGRQQTVITAPAAPTLRARCGREHAYPTACRLPGCVAMPTSNRSTGRCQLVHWSTVSDGWRAEVSYRGRDDGWDRCRGWKIFVESNLILLQHARSLLRAERQRSHVFDHGARVNVLFDGPRPTSNGREE